MEETIRVLHVDDEPDFADLTSYLLTSEEERFEVVTETSASEAVERLHTESVDCIVSDYQMPGMNGLEFLAEVRDEFPDLPFILFTGTGSEDIASEAITTGVTDYLQKGSGTERHTMLANRIVNAVERQQALRQAELSHRAMETANEGLSFVKPDGTFSYVNSSFAQLFGYERDELIGSSWTVLYPDEEAKRLENDILPAVQETGSWSGETVRLTESGDRLVTDHRLTCTDGDAIICTTQDITEERSNIVTQGTLFDLFADAIDGHAFYTLDHEGYVTRWTEGVKQLSGYEADEILGEHISQLFIEADRQQGVAEQLLETARTEGSATHEGWLLQKDGSRVWADETVFADYDDCGAVRGFGTMVLESTAPASV